MTARRLFCICATILLLTVGSLTALVRMGWPLPCDVEPGSGGDEDQPLEHCSL